MSSSPPALLLPSPPTVARVMCQPLRLRVFLSSLAEGALGDAADGSEAVGRPQLQLAALPCPAQHGPSDPIFRLLWDNGTSPRDASSSKLHSGLGGYMGFSNHPQQGSLLSHAVAPVSLGAGCSIGAGLEGTTSTSQTSCNDLSLPISLYFYRVLQGEHLLCWVWEIQPDAGIAYMD